MRVRVGLCVLGLGTAIGFAQDAQLQRHPEPDTRATKLAPPPAAMKAPERLEPARMANMNGLYARLRGRTVNGAAFAVKDLKLKRDAAEITLTSGTVYLMGDVGGMTTGAVFLGEGVLRIDPPSAMEKKQLKTVMKTDVLEQRFTSAVFEFTDGTGAELKKAAGAAAPGTSAAVGLVQEAQALFRHDLRYNVEARLLEDLAGKAAGAGGYFVAVMKGPLFSKRLIYMVDPHGALGVAREEVGLLTSSSEGYDVTLGFRSAEERELTRPTENYAFRVPQQTIEVTIEKGGKLTGTAVTKVTATDDGVKVLGLDIAPPLRVSGVWGPQGEALDFVQEDKLHDADFAVVLPRPLAAGETIQITTSYAGKDAVLDMGSGNYFLAARESWYPNVRGDFGNYAFYTMTFHTPKNVQVVATGDRVSDNDDGKQRTAVWQTLAPMPVAGFNLGEFKMDQSERNKDVQVVSYANTLLADRYSSLPDSGAMGTMSTTGMLKRATSEGDAAVIVYTDYFGPLSYDHISLTQQTPCNYGQSWPTLVYLPICYFWDTTIQHQLGLLDRDPTYWKVVTAHEVAHQWWGQTVGFGSYRDQWMSEGFANCSAALYLMATNKTSKESRDFWTLLRERLLEKNAFGVRPVDVGPVVMGTRLDTSKTGHDVYTSLIYGKGAYILHMLEMLYWSNQDGEKAFKVAMRDFVNRYRNRPASTEDFKAAMERDMPPWTDLEGNHRLDWFFNAYVYGTEIPKYTITSEFTKTGEETSVHFKLTQSNVSDDFRMLVPVYIELDDKRVLLLGRVVMGGTHTAEKTIKLGKLPVGAKRLLVNYNFDLLSE
jgi:hypothetical protein